MTDCPHTEIVLIPPATGRVRCRHCHLTITAEDLAGGYCPECFEVSGQKRYDFDDVSEKTDGKARYRCETCGVMLNPGS